MNSTLVMDLGHALYVGPLGTVPEHRASASAVLVGMDKPFKLVLEGVERSQRVAKVASQSLHALECEAGRMAVFYYDPGVPLVQELTDETKIIAAIDEALRSDHIDAWHKLLALLHPGQNSTPKDARLDAVAQRLTDGSDDAPSAIELASLAQLSVSRLEHLFKDQFGVPLRAFRTWHRFRVAARQLLRGGSITDAALAAGFHDSAHFSRAFRDTFGLPPSHVFTGALQGHCWD